MSDIESWIGRSRAVEDVLEPARSAALLAAVGEPRALAPGDALPPLHHWLYFWDVAPPGALGSDGHPAKGGFLPPIALPRRMWAAGKVEFLRPLRLGAAVSRTSTIRAIESKSGRSGPLIFVTLEHEVADAEGVALREEQRLVYREAATAAASLPPEAPAPDATWREEVAADPVLLFRYSALTMNGHRIHYDRPYAQDEEHYPALVVHGPLQATLLAALAERHAGRPLASFSFRGEQPAYAARALHLRGEPEGDAARLWTQQGADPSMTASARFAAA